MLAAGLLMGSAGGAVAVADPDSSGSAAPGDGGTSASGHSSGADSPAGQDSTLRTLSDDKKAGADTKHDKKGRHGHQARQKDGTDTKDEKKDSGLAAAVPESSRAGSQCGRAGSQCGGAGSQCGGAGSQCGRVGSQCGRAGF